MIDNPRASGSTVNVESFETAWLSLRFLRVDSKMESLQYFVYKAVMSVLNFSLNVIKFSGMKEIGMNNGNAFGGIGFGGNIDEEYPWGCDISMFTCGEKIFEVILKF